LDTDKIEFIDEIKSTFNKTPQIQQCYYVTGEVDFALIMVVNTMREYESLTRKLFFSNSNIRRFKTFGHYLTNCVSKMTWVEQLKSFFINFKNTVCYERRIIFRRIFQAV